MPNLLSFKNIYKTFNTGTIDEMPLFNDFNLEINEGEFVSIVGSNGSGKTTLLNLVSGSAPLDSGEIYLKEENITKVKEHIRARKIGRVYQDPSMGTSPNLTIVENLSLAENKGHVYGLSFALDKKKIERYREMLKSLNLGLEDKLYTKVKKLSGGQRQALALLMATLQPIDLLLLDEHTAALDPKTAEKVLEVTDKIVKENNLTTIMITHNMKDAIKYGNRLIMMSKGKIVADIKGEEKKNLTIETLLDMFVTHSGNDMLSDSAILGD